MSVVAVLDIIGKSIEELQKENQRLKSELSTLCESREFMLSRLRDVEKERDELKVKVDAVQDYADSLKREIEDVSDKKRRALYALNFNEPDEVIYADECENVSKPEETKESGC